MKRAKRSRPVALYVLWAAVFLAATAYQSRATVERFPHWFGGQQRAGWPFLIFADASAPRFTIGFLQPNALHAGLREGEVLTKVNGHVVTGSGVFGEEIAKARNGSVLDTEVRSDQGTIPVAIKLTSGENNPIEFVTLVGAVLMPVFCIVLGFWVTAARPRDRLAWLLLAFLLGFTSFFNPYVEFWGPIVRDLGAIYQTGLNYTWGIWLLLFAVYFPDPLPAGSSGRTFWTWVTWLIALPLGFRAGSDVITSVGTLENYSSVFPLRHLIALLTPLFAVCSYAASIGCMACLAWKWHAAVSRDARRRLSVVLVGALISFPLLLFLNGVAILRHANLEQLFPAWLFGASYLLYFVFPLTIAYAIVVQRAMDVRLIVRQSLQYTLARRGVIVLQAALSAVLFAALAALVTTHALSYAITVLCAGRRALGHFSAEWRDAPVGRLHRPPLLSRGVPGRPSPGRTR